MSKTIGNVDPAFLQQVDIHELLPQQEPFVMVGRLVGLDETTTVSETTIAADNLFVDAGRFTPSGLVENVAQTCAARLGYVNKYVLQQDIQLGFIGAVRNLCIHALPAAGNTIRTTVEVRDEILGMTLAVARVECEGRELLTTGIKIALQEMPAGNPADGAKNEA